MIDDVDRAILTILQDNARTSNAEIARRVGMAASAIHERIRKLEERGVIRGYGVRVDPAAVERGLLAFVFVRTDEPVGALETTEWLKQIPDVQEVHHVAGEDCFLVKVRTADTESLGRLLREWIGRIETVRSTRTTIVLETVKESWTLPVEEGAGSGAEASGERVEAGGD